tara:strand:+ start:1230 stop:1472 length:243 start_codon:yes stop_codon:yes gene_type:complete
MRILNRLWNLITQKPKKPTTPKYGWLRKCDIIEKLREQKLVAHIESEVEGVSDDAKVIARFTHDAFNEGVEDCIEAIKGM